MISFVDRVTLYVAGGNGGHGVASVHREKFKPLGGPDGGNGGDGGDVVLVVDPQTTTLLDYHHSPHRRATSGKGGQGSNRNGANGEDLVLPVPDGTVVKTASGQVLADLVGNGTRFVAAAGGRGGLGNAALASPRRKAPGFALLGEPGEVADLVLELKTVADVALVGYPSAGKSSLVAAMSAAVRRSPTIPSPHSCRTSGSSRPATSATRSPTCPASSRAPARARGWAWSSCATSNGARCSSTWSTARPSSPAGTP